GTGFFLDKCQFHTSRPILALADLNPNSLQVTAKRLERYDPETYIANVWEPLPIDAKFDSIGINYLFHCLPGNFRSQGVVFQNLKTLLNKNGGVIFGTTILGIGIQRNFLAKILMRVYNAKGIFHNTYDHAADLERVLKENFLDYTIRIERCVAFFAGRI
ncbi:MAG TPA: methyltransferase type 12, partial [Anaerolineae bacterium]|nr:methyltransferase type 12 [Anaerolineae bacterium]